MTYPNGQKAKGTWHRGENQTLEKIEGGDEN
jgi:hypothetical protein